MTISPPEYFSRVQSKARDTWNTLEEREELAAPWRQMFLQVTQTPEHVISEFLQNADDAGATNARVRIEQNTLVIEHNGADFNEEDFESLCRFGLSNKRQLLTIGFRGIGFKSGFSLGPIIYLNTHTLSVMFHEGRFTEPRWAAEYPTTNNIQVRIPVSDHRRLERLRKSVEQWKAAPAAILFFNNLKDIEVDGEQITSEDIGPSFGAARQVRLQTSTQAFDLLVVRSEQEAFPDDAIAEIQRERMNQELELPPCTVEVVFGLPGEQKLYSVLPTAAILETTFSINGPFMQTPDRQSVRDLGLSPTNQWLAERAGQLAAKTMYDWLSDIQLSPRERAGAYKLLPPPTNTLADTGDGAISRVLAASFDELAEDCCLLLGTSGKLVSREECAIVPNVLFDIWSTTQIVDILRAGVTELLHPEVASSERSALSARKWVRSFTSDSIVTRFERHAPPRPKTIDALLLLWAFVVKTIRGGAFQWRARRIHVVPIKGSSLLATSDEVTRLTSDRIDHLDALDIIDIHLDIIDPSFLDAIDSVSEESAEEVRLSHQLLREIALHIPTSPASIVERILRKIFDKSASKPSSADHAITLAHYLARENLSIPQGFFWLCQDNTWKSTHDGLLANIPRDESHDYPPQWIRSRTLHERYSSTAGVCRPEQWQRWLNRQRAFIGRHPRPGLRPLFIESIPQLEKQVRNRGGEIIGPYPYKRPNFLIKDYDFDSELLRFWKEKATRDPEIWSRVISRMLHNVPPELLLQASSIRVEQIHGNNKKPVKLKPALSSWIVEFRNLACLEDRTGGIATPDELYRLTANTAPFLSIERFISEELDTQDNSPILDLLGVMSVPGDERRVVSRIRALSGNKNAPIGEVVKWYEILDRIVDGMQQTDIDALRNAFVSEPLVLTNERSWACAQDVYIYPDDDLSGMPSINEAARELAIWRRIGVTHRPTSEHLLERLNALPVGEKLPPDTLIWLRRVLSRLGERVWVETKGWLSLSGRWMGTEVFSFALYNHEFVSENLLFENERHRIADLRMVGQKAEWLNRPPSAEEVIELRIESSSAPAPTPAPAWLIELGLAIFQAAEVPQDVELGARLFHAQWAACERLKIIPYVGELPVGPGYTSDAAWDGDRLLYVGRSRTSAQLAEAIITDLGRRLEAIPLRRALRTCVFRERDFIREYFVTHFSLSEGLVPALPKADSEDDRGVRMSGAGVETLGAREEPEALTSEVKASSVCRGAVRIEPSGGPEIVEPALKDSGASSSDSDLTEEMAAPSQNRNVSPMNGAETLGERQMSSGDRNVSELSRVEAYDEALEEIRDGMDVARVLPKQPRRVGAAVDPDGGMREGSDSSREDLISEYAGSEGLEWSDAAQNYADGPERTLRQASRKGLMRWRYDGYRSQPVYIAPIADGELRREVIVHAEQWELLSQRDDFALLIRIDGRPQLLFKVDIDRLVASQEVAIYPASYRLAAENISE